MNFNNIKYSLLLLLFFISVAHGDENTDRIWSKFLENACSSVDGHFVVEIKRTPVLSDDQPAMRTIIEYWVRGKNLRFDVDDKEGRDLHAQAVVRGDNAIVFDNFDTTNDRVVVSEATNGSKMSLPSRSMWLHFQKLLGRIPFSPLALYDESFETLSTLNRTCSMDIAEIGNIRELSVKSSEGGLLIYRFNELDLNPYEIDVVNGDGVVKGRLRTQWKNLTPEVAQSIAFSGVLESRNEAGELSVNYEWKHLLAEVLPVSSDPFTWESMNLAVGKKRILVDNENIESSGGYWDGKKFSETPISLVRISPSRKVLIWLSVVGLLLGIILMFFKYLRSKGTANYVG